MVRVVCFSDTHGQHRAIKLNKWFEQNPADILVFAGDLQLNSLDYGIDFIHWIASTPYKKKIIVYGNHDGNHEHIDFHAKHYNDIIVLNQTPKTVYGVKFFGSPYSVNFLNWHFMKSETELEDLYRRIPASTDVLITHTPAYGIVDKAPNGYSLGSQALRERIEELPKLKYHICGHIHEGYGIEKHNGTTFINASLLNPKYEMKNEPIKFRINKKV